MVLTIAFDAVILTHDMSRHLHAPVHIGKQCFVGARCMIMPGVNVGTVLLLQLQLLLKTWKTIRWLLVTQQRKYVM